MSADEDLSDPFGFVFNSSSSRVRVIKRTAKSYGPWYGTFKYVVQDNDSLAVYLVKQTIQIPLMPAREFDDMTESFYQLVTIWSEWIHLSSFSHRRGIRAIAMRMWPVLPLSAQQALTDFVKLHNPSATQIEQAREAVSHARRGHTSVSIAIVMEYFASSVELTKAITRGETEGKLSFEDFVGVAYQCCAAVWEVHRLGLVLGTISLSDFRIQELTRLVKLCSYDYVQLEDRQAVTWMPVSQRVAPERLRSATNNVQGPTAGGGMYLHPATFASDIYCLGMALRDAFHAHVDGSSSLANQFSEEFLDQIALDCPRERPTAIRLVMSLTPFLGPIDTHASQLCAEESYVRTAKVYRLPDVYPKSAKSLHEIVDATVNGGIIFTLADAQSERGQGQIDSAEPTPKTAAPCPSCGCLHPSSLLDFLCCR